MNWTGALLGLADALQRTNNQTFARNYTTNRVLDTNEFTQLTGKYAGLPPVPVSRGGLFWTNLADTLLKYKYLLNNDKVDIKKQTPVKKLETVVQKSVNTVKKGMRPAIKISTTKVKTRVNNKKPIIQRKVSADIPLNRGGIWVKNPANRGVWATDAGNISKILSEPLSSGVIPALDNQGRLTEILNYTPTERSIVESNINEGSLPNFNLYNRLRPQSRLALLTKNKRLLNNIPL